MKYVTMRLLMTRLLVLLILNTYSLSGFSSCLDDYHRPNKIPRIKANSPEFTFEGNKKKILILNDDSIFKICSFLEPLCIGKLSKTCRKFNAVVNSSSEGGKSLRANSRNAVTIQYDGYDKIVFFDELLSTRDKVSISKVANLKYVMQNQPLAYMKFLWLSCPPLNESTEENVRVYYEKFQFDDWIMTGPFSGNSYGTLASVLAELVVWNTIICQGRGALFYLTEYDFAEDCNDEEFNEIEEQFNDATSGDQQSQIAKVEELGGIEVRDQLYDLLDNIAGRNVGMLWEDEMEHLSPAYARGPIGYQINRINEMLEDRIPFYTEDYKKMALDLFKQVGQNIRADIVLELVANNSLILSQVSAQAIISSPDFKEVLDDFEEIISRSMTPEQASTICRRVVIPDNSKGYRFIDTQIKRIKNIVPSNS